MKIKIWTSKQFPVICELFLKHSIPLEAAREAIGVITETERYYGENRSMEQAGGFLILFTECCLEQENEIQKLLRKYRASVSDIEQEEVLCSGKGIAWKSVLYLPRNDEGTTVIYPCRNAS